MDCTSSDPELLRWGDKHFGCFLTFKKSEWKLAQHLSSLLCRFSPWCIFVTQQIWASSNKIKATTCNMNYITSFFCGWTQTPYLPPSGWDLESKGTCTSFAGQTKLDNHPGLPFLLGIYPVGQLVLCESILPYEASHSMQLSCPDLSWEVPVCSTAALSLTQNNELSVGLVVALQVLIGSHCAVVHPTVSPSCLVNTEVSI